LTPPSEMSVFTNHNYSFIVLIADNRLNRTLLAPETDQALNQFVYAEDRNQTVTVVQSIKFGLIVVAVEEYSVELNNFIKSTDALNYKTPVIALSSTDEGQRLQKELYSFDDFLVGNDLEKKLIQTIDYWRIKVRTIEASKYIQKIQKKTKYNEKLTYIIFSKLFEELPSQVLVIEDALGKQHYSVAKDTVHNLHGSVSFCDLEDIRKVAFALESCLLTKKPESIKSLFLMLKTLIFEFLSCQEIILRILSSTEKDSKPGR
jgi:HPt (histidine-containing phosphotransfer) domain-containing protein